MRRPFLVFTAVAAVALLIAGTAAAGNGGFAPQPPASPNASRISDAYWVIFGFTAAVFVLVETALVWFAIRYRRRGRPREAEGPQLHGATRLEMLWTAGPVLILAAIAAFIFYKLPGIKNVPPASAGSTLTVKVRAQQYYWQFQYPDGQISIDRMLVPAGEVVRLVVTSADVAHSWWIPSLGGKIDAIPGRTNTTWFEADRTGVYSGQCAELCGIQHALMRADVAVVTRGRYEEFLAAHSPGSSTVGAEVFQGVCAKCHGPAGQGDVGPKIAGSPVLADQQALVQLLRSGKNRMPAVGRLWSDAQMKAATTYLKGHLAGS